MKKTSSSLQLPIKGHFAVYVALVLALSACSNESAQSELDRDPSSDSVAQHLMHQFENFDHLKGEHLKSGQTWDCSIRSLVGKETHEPKGYVPARLTFAANERFTGLLRGALEILEDATTSITKRVFRFDASPPQPGKDLTIEIASNRRFTKIHEGKYTLSEYDQYMRSSPLSNSFRSAYDGARDLHQEGGPGYQYSETANGVSLVIPAQSFASVNLCIRKPAGLDALLIAASVSNPAGLDLRWYSNLMITIVNKNKYVENTFDANEFLENGTIKPDFDEYLFGKEDNLYASAPFILDARDSTTPAKCSGYPETARIIWMASCRPPVSLIPH